MENKDMTVKNSKELVKANITAEDIKKYFCPLANEKELYMALGVVKSLNLNPFTREVHLIKYNNADKLSIIVGYEVYLKRAERTGKLDGWKSGIDEKAGTAWVEILRKDWKEPFRWEVSLTEFDKKQATWKQMPSFMGKKVAIAQGFRMAFPDELGGLPYTQEEYVAYDIIPDTEEVQRVEGKPVVEKPHKVDKKEKESNTRKKMAAAFEKEKERLGIQAYSKIIGAAGFTSPEEMTIEEGRKIIALLKAEKVADAEE